MKKTAIVILNWNGKNFLKKFLPRIAESVSDTKDSILYIADNNSTDSSLDFVENNFPNIKIIKLEKNYGYAGGYAKSLKQIEAKYFVLLNSDIEITDNWINPIVEMMDADEKISAVMPKILSYNDKKNFEYAGAGGGYIDKYGFPFCRGRVLNVIEKDNGQFDDIKEIFWASGACLFLRSDSYFEVGGLDDNFFAHMEEIDLCWRLQNANYKVMYNPESTVYHVGGGTLPNNTPRKMFYNFRNNLLLLYKNLPPTDFIKILIIRFCLDFISIIIFCAKLQFSFAISVSRAHFSFFKMIRRYKNYRKNYKNYKNENKNIYTKSILWSFFIKKKRFYKLLRF